MKLSWAKTAVTLVGASVALYFQKLAIPLIVLFCAVVMDYATGLLGAYLHRELSSERGWQGILKKIAYFAAVCVGCGVDYLLTAFGALFGVTFQTSLAVGVLVTMWLIINESISVLENLVKIGVPLPTFLGKLVKRLQVAVEEKLNGDENKENNREDSNKE